MKTQLTVNLPEDASNITEQDKGVSFKSGGTQYQVQVMNFYEATGFTPRALLKFRANVLIESYKTRRQVKKLVHSLNKTFQQFDFKYVGQKVDTIFPHNCCKIDIRGLEDPINGFYLGSVWGELYEIANEGRWEDHGTTIQSPDLEGIMSFEVEIGENKNKIRNSICTFLDLYNKARAQLKSTNEIPVKDIADNIKQTANMLGYTKWINNLGLADQALGYCYRKMPSEKKKDFGLIMGYIFGNHSDPNWQKLRKTLISKGLVKSDASST